MADYKTKVVVIGAGPVGALAALYAARRGYEVEVYELRGDLRLPGIVPLNFTKSINLALSQRGISALRGAGSSTTLIDSILADTIPMHGRMIHGKDVKGSLFSESQKYDVHGRAIRAADRAGLNKALLDELEQLPNVKLFFNHKLTGADFKSRLAWLEQRDPQNPTDSTRRPPEIEISFDFLIGADGAHSSVRFHLMKHSRINYHQEYIDTLWCEFHMDPDPLTGDFAISPHHLHIWPAGTFMFIAIPSTDKSFTCTLFMPAGSFDYIDEDRAARLVPFFEQHFPGVAGRLIEEDMLHEQYTSSPHLPLISIKCTPYHFAASAVILGDAAHAMVPFYGQGMNAGMEDVRHLFSVLDEHVAPKHVGRLGSPAEEARRRAAALDQYTRTRTPDAYAINDLAMGNYTEMRHDVRSPLYLLRKRVEELLSVWAPRLGFVTQYTRVSFSDEPYAQVIRSVDRQARILKSIGAAVFAGSVGLGLAGAWWLRVRRASLW